MSQTAALETPAPVKIRYTNNNNIPLPLAVYLATDHYDYDPTAISATSLLKPVRQIVLKPRVPQTEQLIDVDSLIQSSLGTSIHNGIEHAWTTNYARAMRELGHDQDLIDRVIINPNPELVTDDQVPIYMEQRHYRMIEIGGQKYKISGKMDFIANGILHDFKSTSAFTYKHSNKDEDYRLQGSIYRWLAPEIITGDYIRIHYIFMDWAKYKLLSEKNYPPKRMHSVKLSLLSLEETEEFIRQKLTQIIEQQTLPEQEITFCNDRELWRSEDTFKYYKNPENAGVPGKRSTANFTTMAEAHARLEKDGNVGQILTVKGQVKACKYCPCISVCSQKDQYLQDGSLVLDDE